MIKDPNLLLSLINTALRDKYSSFEDYCLSEDVDGNDVIQILFSIGYVYSEELNSFIQK